VVAAVLAAAACGGGGGTHAPPYQVFRSRPDLRPPVVATFLTTRANDGRDLFLTPNSKSGRSEAQSGPLILDAAGRVVWFDPVATGATADFRAQRYRGRPVLTWWQGVIKGGIGNGVGIVLDDHYRPLALVHAGDGLDLDVHEFLLTPQNTAFVIAFRHRRANLTAVGGPADGVAVEAVVQEIDVASGRILFDWRSLDHIAPGESYLPYKGGPYDYLHLNSIDPEPGGRLLLSGRNTHALYEVDRRSGRVVWRLGGKRSDFRMGPGTRFAWQHDARRQAPGTITLFDDGAAPPVERHSRGLVLHLDTANRTVRLVHAYVHPKGLLASSQGNMQVLPDRDVVIGWGSVDYATEFTPSGRVVRDYRFGDSDDQSYRAYRLPWQGRPLDPPALALEPSGGGRTTAFASWNGATGVARWQLLGGRDEQHVTKPLREATASGFETAVRVKTDETYLAVRAVDRAGRTLGTSLAVKRPH
jgi:hypothetical protein